MNVDLNDAAFKYTNQSIKLVHIHTFIHHNIWHYFTKCAWFTCYLWPIYMAFNPHLYHISIQLACIVILPKLDYSIDKTESKYIVRIQLTVLTSRPLNYFLTKSDHISFHKPLLFKSCHFYHDPFLWMILVSVSSGFEQFLYNGQTSLYSSVLYPSWTCTLYWQGSNHW